MLETLKPWAIIDKDEYATFVEDNILKKRYWKISADKFRVSFQKIFGEDRLSRYIWMVTGPAIFWLITSYRMKGTVRADFGCDPQESMNGKWKDLFPKITRNFASTNKNMNGV